VWKLSIKICITSVTRIRRGRVKWKISASQHFVIPSISCESLLELSQLLVQCFQSRFAARWASCVYQLSWLGRAIAKAVSRWLPTAVARVQSRVWLSGICGGQSGVGAGFLRVLRFPLPIFIPPNSPSSQSPGAGTIGQ
jgi:hypothetical protein